MDNYQSLVKATQDKNHIQGLTHNFYKYPARFSPDFARETIKCFSNPGDTVVDPFVGGGTTAVEALASGRLCVGIDISSLAIFISKVKTTPLKNNEISIVKNWSKKINSIKAIRNIQGNSFWVNNGYLNNLNGSDTWRTRNLIENLLFSTKNINNYRVEDFIRCAILRTGQWAVDGKRDIPNVDYYRSKLSSNISMMLEKSQVLLKEINKNKTNRNYPSPFLINRSAIGIESEEIFIRKPVKLILMSPPYPGVHVLYHRWQIKGRRETPAPFWIANQPDGSGASYYTFGNRQTHEKKQYFNEMQKVFHSLAKICDKNTRVIQLIAFSDPSNQLKRYLKLMRNSGFTEIFLNNKITHKRIWRKVPNRKWYADLHGDTSSSKEVLLVHKLGN